MNPTDFPEANLRLLAPPSMPECLPLLVHRYPATVHPRVPKQTMTAEEFPTNAVPPQETVTELGGFISRWEPTPEERAALAAGGAVWVYVVGDGSPPPIAVSGVNPFETPQPLEGGAFHVEPAAQPPRQDAFEVADELRRRANGEKTASGCALCGEPWPHTHTEEQLADWQARGGARGKNSETRQGAIVLREAGGQSKGGPEYRRPAFLHISPAEQPTTWFSVAEFLPPNAAPVLAWDAAGPVVAGFYYLTGDWTRVETGGRVTPTHWMSFGEPADAMAVATGGRLDHLARTRRSAAEEDAEVEREVGEGLLALTEAHDAPETAK